MENTSIVWKTAQHVRKNKKIYMYRDKSIFLCEKEASCRAECCANKSEHMPAYA